MNVDINSRSDETVGPPIRDDRRRVLAFEIEVEGHHPSYIQNFAHAWIDRKIPAKIDFLVTPRFFDLHADVVDEVQNISPDDVRILSVTDDEFREMERSHRLRYFKGWRLYCDYARRLGADHGLLMYFDFFQLPLLTGPASPCPFSVIYFRPTFHYHLFQSFVPTLKERFRAKRKEVVLRRVLRNPQLQRLYCLDRFAVDYIRDNFRADCDVSVIADSFAVYEASTKRQDEIRAELGVEPDRTVFCLIGALDRRKGVRELLECLPLVPEQIARKCCLLLIGVVEPSQKHDVYELVNRLQRSSPMQIILRDAYVRSDQFQHYYDLSDVIMATYQGHMGNSSALIRAALAQKPALSSNYGLMGEIVRRRRLGVTVDTSSPADMAAGFQQFIDNEPATLFDYEESLRYAKENSRDQLATDLSAMVDSTVV